MRILPVVCVWTKVDVIYGDGEVQRRMAWVPLPRYANLAAKQNHEGEEYPLAPVEARSRASHNQFFAALNEGFDSLPHDLKEVAARLNIKTIPPDGFVDSEHFRAWALCQTGHCDVLEFDFDSPKDATMVAKLYRRKDTYAQILKRGAHITIKEAKSQSAAAMAKEPFEASKRDVLDLLETMIGVAKGTLMKEAGEIGMSRTSETLDPATYGGLPGFKELTTSKDAAVAVASKASTLREKVYAVICAAGGDGKTSDEVAAALGEDWRAIRPRLSELKKAGRIKLNGVRRANDTGLKAGVLVKA